MVALPFMNAHCTCCRHPSTQRRPFSGTACEGAIHTCHVQERGADARRLQHKARRRHQRTCKKVRSRNPIVSIAIRALTVPIGLRILFGPCERPRIATATALVGAAAGRRPHQPVGRVDSEAHPTGIPRRRAVGRGPARTEPLRRPEFHRGGAVRRQLRPSGDGDCACAFGPEGGTERSPRRKTPGSSPLKSRYMGPSHAWRSDKSFVGN